MFKIIIFLITLGSVGLTYLLSQQISIDNVDPENLKIQFYFIYAGEIIFGCLLSGMFCSRKNEFEPYHILQIFLGVVYVLIEFCLTGLILANIGKSTLILINSSVTFVFISIVALSMLANFYSNKSINN